MRERSEHLAKQIAQAKEQPMTPEEVKQQARDFAYGNAKLSGIEVTREEVNQIADQTCSACRGLGRHFGPPGRFCKDNVCMECEGTGRRW